MENCIFPFSYRSNFLHPRRILGTSKPLFWSKLWCGSRKEDRLTTVAAHSSWSLVAGKGSHDGFLYFGIILSWQCIAEERGCSFLHVDDDSELLDCSADFQSWNHVRLTTNSRLFRAGYCQERTRRDALLALWWWEKKEVSTSLVPPPPIWWHWSIKQNIRLSLRWIE